MFIHEVAVAEFGFDTDVQPVYLPVEPLLKLLLLFGLQCQGLYLKVILVQAGGMGRNDLNKFDDFVKLVVAQVAGLKCR